MERAQIVRFLNQVMNKKKRRKEQKMNRIIKVPIKKLKKDIYVRVKRDEERVYYFFGLIVDGKKVPPIKITEDFKIIDGRHRVEAHEEAEKEEIEAEIVKIKDKRDFIVQAYKANLGGSLPPTQEDTEHTIKMLLEQGVSRKKIRNLLDLPSNLGSKYVDNVASKLKRRKLQAAADDVTNNNLTVTKAAEKHGLKPENLKSFLSGKKKKKNQGGISEMKANFTTRYRGLGAKNGKDLSEIRRRLEDADISLDEAQQVLNKLKILHSKSFKTIQDWEDRFKSAYEQGQSE